MNIKQVAHATRGRIARKAECSEAPGIGNLFVVIDEHAFLSRTIAVKKMNILAEPPLLMAFA